MDTPEQVISKIRQAPDDATAMKVLKECGYELEATEPEDEPESKGKTEVEIELRPGMSPREKFMADRLGGMGR